MPSIRRIKAIARLVGLTAAGVVLTAAAAELPPRIELSDGPNPAELVGVYRVEPTLPGNPTTTMRFLRLAADGSVRGELLTLGDSAGRLVPQVRAQPRTDLRWFVTRPGNGGSFAARVRRPRLCLGPADGEVCVPFERNASTGDITRRLEPVIARRGGGRLVRLRSNAIGL